MSTQFNEKFISYLALITGLSISGVAIYYSVMGLTAIFAAAVVPIIIMGVILEIGKLVATLWLKQHWKIAPFLIKIYLLISIIMLMLLTSMGIFGYLSKAHTDQSLVSGDVQSKIAIYDERIRISRENIDANRAALRQLDSGVDQTLARSTSEQGAERSVQIRRQQGPERQRLLREIETEQKKIAELNEERAPIAAELRKVEAEVGPIKYIAALIYGDDLDTNLLEKSVRWVIIMIVITFDPLAVILLLASQFSLQRSQSNLIIEPVKNDAVVAVEHNADTREFSLEKELKIPINIDFKNFKLPVIDKISNLAYLKKQSVWKIPDIDPVPPQVYVPEQETESVKPVDQFEGQEYVTIDGETMHVSVAREKFKPKLRPYVQNEEQEESGNWNRIISEQEYREKINQKNGT